MSCLENVCKECEYTEFNNIGLITCPKCNGEVTNYCDEDYSDLSEFEDSREY